jgi:hypothetical protein
MVDESERSRRHNDPLIPGRHISDVDGYTAGTSTYYFETMLSHFAQMIQQSIVSKRIDHLPRPNANTSPNAWVHVVSP